MKHTMELPPEDEPLMKKQKTEESLEPEIQFMMKFNVDAPILFFFYLSYYPHCYSILGSSFV